MKAGDEIFIHLNITGRFYDLFYRCSVRVSP
jgi:hypothetical protein